MSDIQSLIKTLQSKNPDNRYDACEELRVLPVLPPEALEALRLATNDVNPDVADAAQRAIALHASNKDTPQTSRVNGEPSKVGEINNIRMEKKNPLIAGFLNLLIPGLGHLYIGRWPGCILWFFIYIVTGGILLLLANYVERFGRYQEGISTLIASLLYAFLLFSDGVTFANRHNKKVKQDPQETKKTEEQEDIQAKLKKLQEMFNAGLITQQEYESKKADILSRM